MEVCVDCVESAINAVRGGAKRLELCSALSEGGLTPSVGLLKVIKSQIVVPVFCMIRPRCGDFVYSDLELTVMERDISTLLAEGADGIVLGCLTTEGEVDVKSCTRLISAVNNSKQGCPMTFHRAIDMSKDLFLAADTIKELGFTRILTSGGMSTAVQGKEEIRLLIERLKDVVIVVPGAGINHHNLVELLRHTNAFEFHASAREVKESAMTFRNKLSRMGGDDSADDYSRLVTSRDSVDRLVTIYKNVKMCSL